MIKNLTEFEPRRILALQQRQIGDVLLATPALELLKKRYPKAELHLFTELKCEPLLRYNPHIDVFHLLDKKKLNTLPRQIAWYRLVASHGFDLVVDFQQLPRCQWIAALSRAKVRLSFPAPRFRWFRRAIYNHTAIPEEGYAAHTKASLLTPLGIEAVNERPRIYLKPFERDEARKLLAHNGLLPSHTLVTVDPTHRRITRRWPARHFAALMDLLAENDASLRFLVLRGPGEEEYIQELVGMCRQSQAILLPKTIPDIRISAACMAEASLHIGNCSAPRHMAVALGVPSLVIPGSSGPQWAYPSAEHVNLYSGMSCQPCLINSCKHRRCLEELDPGLAALEARRLLARAEK